MPNDVHTELTPSSATPVTEPAPKTQKKLVRRTAPDRSQRIRLIVQCAFVLLNIFLCAQFYLFVRFFETASTGSHVSRPAGVDGWLPIAGLMNVRYLLATGHVPAIHPAAMVLFFIFVTMSLILKRAFCGWLCPVGTLSEYLWKAGRKLFGRNLVLPRWLDIPLRSIKYLLMAFFMVIIGNMTAVALEDFMMQPYGILADVKMLHFFVHMSTTALITVAVLMLLSVMVKNFWCRYACPYGAVTSVVSLVSPIKIRRDQESCVDCGKCANACPQNLPVDRLIQVSSAECTACLECVASCPAQNALQFALPPRAAAPIAQRWSGRALQPLAAVLVLAALFFGGIGLARITHHWQTNVSDDVYRQLIPQVDEASHPGF
jgi:polyferredoxin